MEQHWAIIWSSQKKLLGAMPGAGAAHPAGTSPCPLARGSASPRWLLPEPGQSHPAPSTPSGGVFALPGALSPSRREGSPLPGPHPQLPTRQQQDLQAADTDILRGRGRLCRGAEPSSSRFHSQIYWCCEENETMWSRARSSQSRRKFPER